MAEWIGVALQTASIIAALVWGFSSLIGKLDKALEEIRQLKQQTDENVSRINVLTGRVDLLYLTYSGSINEKENVRA